MKVVINTCFGGFSLSAKAVKRLAELQGRPCYFFKQDISEGLDSPFIPISTAQAEKEYLFFSFDIPNPNEILTNNSNWHKMSFEEKQASNAKYESHKIDSRPDKRDDPVLIRVVEELGKAANGKHADLKVVEIPDGVEWEIDEYDGTEHIDEVHRSWR